MTYEYTIEFFSMERTAPAAEEPEKAGNVVYACGAEGECAVKDIREEQMKLLEDFLNDMGSKGWELVQVLLSPKGAVSFWKRPVVNLTDQNV